MRKYLIGLVVGLSLAFSLSLGASETGKRFGLDWGFYEWGNNELSIVSTVDDPPKLRMAASHGVGSGAMSWSRFIDGAQRENVLIQGKQDERYRNDPRNSASEITVHLNDGGGFEDRNMVRVLELRKDTIELLGVPFTQDELRRIKVIFLGR